MDKPQTVTNMVVLRGMEKQGLIKLHPQTGREVSSPFGQVTAFYIDEAIKKVFEYRGIRYREVYKSGSFYPYIETYPIQRRDY